MRQTTTAIFSRGFRRNAWIATIVPLNPPPRIRMSKGAVPGSYSKEAKPDPLLQQTLNFVRVCRNGVRKNLLTRKCFSPIKAFMILDSQTRALICTCCTSGACVSGANRI